MMSLSLFDQLRHLYRKDEFQLEDFHTEIVAQVLRNSETLTLTWLRAIGVTDLTEADTVEIVTQEKFQALVGHATNSRPDMAIRLQRGGRLQLILVESKVGAKEGPDQLKRYADQLVAKTDAERTGLIFVTRDFEPNRTFTHDPKRFTYRQTRWFVFFELLKGHANGDGLANQLVLFMEENRMSLRNQFTAIDCVALENFLAAKSLMDEILWTEVADAFAKTLGKVSAQGAAMTQLRKHDRYIMLTGFGTNWGFQCMLGYWLPNSSPSDQVWVGVTLESNAKSPVRSKIDSAFRAFAKKQGSSWEHDRLDSAKEWGALYKGEPLSVFLGKSDHIQAIKHFFLGLLKELEKFKKQTSDLPWIANTLETEEC